MSPIARTGDFGPPRLDGESRLGYDESMKIKSAEFVKGVAGEDEILRDEIPQVAFIGRSNVGKSSVINSLAGRELARSSSVPGKTREINFYLINKEFYLTDLPGYGYAKASLEERDQLRQLILWYLLFANIDHKKIVLIIDAEVGPTEQDMMMTRRINERQKDLIIVANKSDKIKKSQYQNQIRQLQAKFGINKVIPYSAKEGKGVAELMMEIIK